MSRYIIEDGKDSNALHFFVTNCEVKPEAKLHFGDLRVGWNIKMTNYNLESLLVQLLEDYGEAKIMEVIKSIN